MWTKSEEQISKLFKFSGQEYSVDENSHIIEGVIQEEIVGDYAEEVEVEEEIVMDIDPVV